ncbi:MAG: hypothetical protein ACM309_00805 [Bacillota bacterium]
MDRDKATATDRAIDYDLWRRAREVLGRPRAVTLWTCPRCGEETLVWPGVKGTGARCLNRKCGLAYQDFSELVTGQEAWLAAKREEEMRQLIERHDTYKRVRGAVRQVRHG